MRGLTQLVGHRARSAARAYRLVIDYSYSPVALVLPLVLPYLNAEVISLHAFTDEQKTHRGRRPSSASTSPTCSGWST